MPSYVYAAAAPGIGASRNATGGLYRLEVETSRWAALTTGLPHDVEARCIAADAATPRILFLGTQFGLFRGSDGGESWSPL